MAKPLHTRRCSYCKGKGTVPYPSVMGWTKAVCQDCQGNRKVCILCGQPSCECLEQAEKCDQCNHYTYACKCN